MSDHVSGPRAIADPVADITDVYAFPCPENPQHLVLIMNVFPFAGPLRRYLPRYAAALGHLAEVEANWGTPRLP
jgi:hypothetical protein